MNVGLYTGDPTSYRLAAAQRPGVVLRTLSPYHPDLSDLDALVIDDASAPMYALTRAALARGVHVFARPRATLTVRQLVVLREAALRAGRRLHLAAPCGDSGPLKSLRRSLRQDDGPRHLRVVRRIPHTASLDDATFEELAFVASLIDAAPSSVACFQADASDPVVRLVTLTAPGALVSVVVTSVESGGPRDVVATAGSRTLRFTQSPEGEHRLAVSASDRGGAVRSTEIAEAVLRGLVREAETFFAELEACHEAVAADHRPLAPWARAALLWDAARGSLEQGGAPTPVLERPLLTNNNPPPLRLIVGGGSDGPARARPTLTVVR
ncbi:MAG TPA: hypothetical protein VNM43_09015 [Dehalococcoidia bacterium]|nr:hypothetical protein [Dehalococcoidia bacterium]